MPTLSRTTKAFWLITYLVGPGYRPQVDKIERLFDRLDLFTDDIREPYRSTVQAYLSNGDGAEGYSKQLIHHGRGMLDAVMSARGGAKELIGGLIEPIELPVAVDGMIRLIRFNEAVFGSSKSSIVSRNLERLGITLQNNALTVADAKKLLDLKKSGNLGGD